MENLSHTVGQTLIVLDMVGVAVFAVTGALLAARKEMDPIGFMVVGAVTAIGGGTLRDLILGVRPVFWVDDSIYLWIALIAALATFWGARVFNRIYPVLLWLDAVGMALFAVGGAQKAAALQAPALIAVVMGVMTAGFGGVIRDVLCGEKPLLFHKEIYATAAAVGSAVWLGLNAWGEVSVLTQTLIAASTAFLVRAAAIIWELQFPSYKPVKENE